MGTITVKWKRLHKDAHVPTRGSREAAGYDLYACLGEGKTVFIKPGETVMISTGVALEIPAGWFGQLHGRSGLSTKKGLRLSTGVSIVDADYRGDVFIGIHNDSGFTREIENGDRIAQIVFQKHPEVKFIEVDELAETERGSGGFGSTGKK